jgi:hypothetical protein
MKFYVSQVRMIHEIYIELKLSCPILVSYALLSKMQQLYSTASHSIMAKSELLNVNDTHH